MELQPFILGALMSQPLIVGVLLALFARIIDRRERGRHDEMRDRIDRFEDRVDREFQHVRGELGQVRVEVASLRSDITHVALALGIQARPQTG